MRDCELVGTELNQQAPGRGSLSADRVRELKATINVKTCVFDIAAITSNAVTGERIITYKLKSSRKAQYIPTTSEYFETLSYPLIFLQGERGWGTDIAKAFPFAQYLCARMLAPERCRDGTPLMCLNKPNTRWLHINRMQLFARVAQLYLVDMLSRAIDFRLFWQRKNRDYMFGIPSANPQVINANAILILLL